MRQIGIENPERGFIANILAIGVVLIIVFLSQSDYGRAFAHPVFEPVEQWGGKYWGEAHDWFKATIYPRVSSEVEKRGEVVQEEINEQKNAAAQSLWGSIKHYFAEKFSKLFGTKVE